MDFLAGLLLGLVLGVVIGELISLYRDCSRGDL